MPSCTFCEKTFNAKGKMHVKSNGKLFYFCSSKCEKNMLGLGRKPAKIEWASKKSKKEV